MGWGGYRNEPALRPADFGRPDHRPVVSAKFSAKKLGGGSAGRTTARWFGRPNRPAEPPPSFSAEDHRRASPPFHSDELNKGADPTATVGGRVCVN